MTNTDDLKTLPSKSYHAILDLMEEIKAEAFAVANRGLKTARTRLRNKLSELAKLCKEARKEIPPASQEWP